MQLSGWVLELPPSFLIFRSPVNQLKPTPILFGPTKLIGLPNKLAEPETSGAESWQGSNVNFNSGDSKDNKILEGPGVLKGKHQVMKARGRRGCGNRNTVLE